LAEHWIGRSLRNRAANDVYKKIKPRFFAASLGDFTMASFSTSTRSDSHRARAMLGYIGRALAAALLLWSAAAAAQEEATKPARKLDVWYVPTPHEIVDRMLDVAKVRPGDVVYDLGCGDGRIVIAAAKKFGTRGIGVDLDPARIREARANAKAAGVEDMVTFKVADLFQTDLSEATVVTLYLLPELNKRLKPKLFAELQPGTRVVSHDFDMGRDWKPDKELKLGSDGIYLWIMPEKGARPAPPP
jgi:SAM-dependent methyltransferase